jgi:hypothetical protein
VGWKRKPGASGASAAAGGEEESSGERLLIRVGMELIWTAGGGGVMDERSARVWLLVGLMNTTMTRGLG